MTDLGKLTKTLAEAMHCYDGVAQSGNLEPVLTALKEIKSNYLDALNNNPPECNSPKDFIRKKSFDSSSQYTVDAWPHDSRDSFIISFKSREDQKKITEAVNAFFGNLTRIVDNHEFYADAEKFVGIYL